MTEFQRKEFAGFWLRFVALVIDVIVVSLIVFPFALLIGMTAPNAMVVEAPFGLFTTTTTIAEQQDSSIEKDNVLGRWTYYYEVSAHTDFDGETSSQRTLIDPETKLPIKKTTSSDIEFYVIFIYWILLEASVWQASLGKRIMGLQVVTADGSKPTIYQCAARNLLKILSGITLFIGFMMAGWTDKKQSLHDMIPQMLVVKKSHDKPLAVDDLPKGTSV